jgi:molybdopterin adenylyltransferase
MVGKVVSVNISDRKGVRKRPVREAVLRTAYGIEGDAHASSDWHRQVSLLAIESIRKMQALGLDVKPGDFAENITTEGLDLVSLPVGARMEIGSGVVAEVSQIGKECRARCAIYDQAGDCVMPKEGIFVKVLKGGKVLDGDIIRVGSTPWITVAILTLSDKGARGERKDLSGPAIGEMLKAIGAEVRHYVILPDDKDSIKEKLVEYSEMVDLVLTTGGTGLSPRDVTPEATREVIDREIPGIAEAMRLEGLKKTPRSMLSRAIAGVRGKTLIINLPGSPKAVQENLDVILEVIPHALEKIRGSQEDCAR